MCCQIVEQYDFALPIVYLRRMKNNSGQPQTPFGSLTGRLRLNSYNSPFISPLRLAQSPFLHESNFLDGNQSHTDFHHFQLEDNPPVQPEEEQINQDEQEEQSIPSPPPLPQHEHDDDIILDQTNMLEFILSNSHLQKKLDQARATLEGYGSNFLVGLFDYLVGKFKKLKKTKEEMVKYCVRKSFKHITTKMRNTNKQAYANMENNEVVAEYFQLNNEGDLSISMPFKKSSEEKTMNSNFLKKIFQCRQYNIDYKEFLKQFPAEYTADNKKKIKSMNDVIKKCMKNKSYKGLDQYKRLPWTQNILRQIYDFARDLMNHSPYKKGALKDKQPVMRQPREEGQSSKEQHENQLHGQNEFGLMPAIPVKKSIIILTPPIRPLAEPEIPDEDIL